jgi:endonuclease/exonuclease/phosphatase family metal-dependent hydrolase
MRVLAWNLFHGRSLPPAGRALAAEFAMRLDGWEWDVALLQEVPPWWPPQLARLTEAEQRTALTSRNAALSRVMLDEDHHVELSDHIPLMAIPMPANE